MQSIKPDLEEQTVDLFLKYGIKYVEAAAYMQITPALVRFRLQGLQRNPDGTIEIPHYVVAKVSRPEVAEAFMSPAPVDIVKKIGCRGQLTEEEARLGAEDPTRHMTFV